MIRRVLRLDRIDSTNEEAKRRAAEGDPGDLWILATRQDSGRGRRGRAWDSALGNLFCTALLRPDCEAHRCAQLAFVAGLAAAQAADRWVDPSLVSLKWPNDVLVAGAKACGILLETGLDTHGRWLAVGVGMNLIAAPAQAAWPATHLAGHLRPGAPPPPPEPEAAMAALADAFEAWMAQWRAEGFAPVRSAWLSRAGGLGAPVIARLPDCELHGVFEDVDADGALVLRLQDGARRTVAAGDVFFTGPRAGERAG